MFSESDIHSSEHAAGVLKGKQLARVEGGVQDCWGVERKSQGWSEQEKWLCLGVKVSERAQSQWTAVNWFQLVRCGGPACDNSTAQEGQEFSLRHTHARTPPTRTRTHTLHTSNTADYVLSFRVFCVDYIRNTRNKVKNSNDINLFYLTLFTWILFISLN